MPKIERFHLDLCGTLRAGLVVDLDRLTDGEKPAVRLAPLWSGELPTGDVALVAQIATLARHWVVDVVQVLADATGRTVVLLHVASDGTATLPFAPRHGPSQGVALVAVDVPLALRYPPPEPGAGEVPAMPPS